MTNTLQNILVVEDNPDFRAGCFDGFGMPEINAFVAFSEDYNEAMARINGAIVDCFFPFSVCSNDLKYGKKAIDKMLASDERGRRIEEFDKYLSEFLDYTDPALRRIARYLGSTATSGPETCPVAQSIKQVSKISKEFIGNRLKNDSSWLFKDLGRFKDNYDDLRNAMEEDEANQPLGILVAEELQYRRIPFVLATSTHHHDSLTQPIQDYCSKHRWTLVDCNPGNPNEKAQASFWQRAYKELLHRMERN